MITVTNGQVPRSLLVPVAGQWLRAGTASRWAQACVQVARRYGWTPTIYPDGAYRDILEQQAIFRARYTVQATGSGPYGDVRFWNGVRYVRTSPLGAAAVPGTSNHGLGRAIDVYGLTDFGSTKYAQFAATAGPLGFSNAEGRAVGEPWHWVDTLDPDAIAASNVVASGGASITAPGALDAPTPLEDDMYSDQDRARDEAVYGWLQGLQPTLATDVPAIKAQIDALQVADTRNRIGNIQYALGILLARDPQTVSAADIANAIPTDLAKAVADELSKRLAQ